VTGAANGLGAEYAKQLAAQGARVLVADIRGASETVASIHEHAVGVIADVSSELGVNTIAAVVGREFGGCDILVNNAGVSSTVAWDELTFAEWRRVMSVNLDSMFLTCQALIPGMRDRGFGRVINVSSNTVALVIPGFVHYAASKAGIIGLTRALATEMGDAGITVNAILPGLTQTEVTQKKYAGTTFFDDMAQRQAIKRPGVPSDIAGVVSFLASDAAGWVTGQAMVVAGGLLRH
jgi:NAD(P)-dependent dehydrogenase (short-subunit alcohol dehydrogenase family)